MFQALILTCLIVVLLSVWHFYQASLKNLLHLALWIGWPISLWIFTGLANNKLFNLEYSNAFNLMVALLCMLSIVKVVTIRKVLSIGEYIKQINWTDLAIIYSVLTFIIHYLAINSMGLLNLDFATFTTFDFSSYRMLRHRSWLDMYSYDVEIIQPAGTRWYIAFSLWLSSFYAKWSGISNPLIPDPIWFYRRVANISIFIAQAATIFSIFMVGKKLFKPIAGFCAMIIIGTLTSVYLNPFFLRYDWPVLLFACLSFWWYLHFLDSGRFFHLALVGVMAGIAILFRLTAIPIILAISLHFLWIVHRKSGVWSLATVRAYAFFVFLFVLPVMCFYVVSKPHLFYWKGLYNQAKWNMEVYLGWSANLGEGYKPIMELSIIERFKIVLEIFATLLENNIILIGLSIIALLYFIAWCRNSLIFFLTLSNLLFWLLICYFPETLAARLTNYFYISAISLIWPLSGFLTVEFKSAIQIIVQKIRQRPNSDRIISTFVLLVMIILIVQLGWQSSWIFVVKERITYDLSQTHDRIINEIPFGSSILINNSLGGFQGTVPNPNIYENFGSDMDQQATGYITTLVDYFINVQHQPLYKQIVDRNSECTEWGVGDLVCHNYKSLFNRRATIYDHYLDISHEHDNDLLSPDTTLNYWSIIWNGKLFRDIPLRGIIDREKSWMILSTPFLREITLQGKENLQPSGVGFFRKRFNYDIRIPYTSEYDTYYAQERHLHSYVSSLKGHNSRADQPMTLIPPAATGDKVIKNYTEDGNSFLRVFTSTSINTDTVIQSSRIWVEPEKVYKIEFVLRSKGIYTVVPEVYELDDKDQHMRTPYEPFHLSSDFKHFSIEYRPTARTKEIEVRLVVQRIVGILDIQDIRIWVKGSDRVFDMAQAVQVLPLEVIRGDRELVLEYEIEEVGNNGQVNLDVIYESPEGLMINRRIYHLFNKDMRLWDNTEYLSNKEGHKMSISIPLWKDFKRSSSYTALPYFVKIYLTVVTPRGEALKANFSEVKFIVE